MKVLHRLSAIYIVGLVLFVIIILVAVFSFTDIYRSSEKIVLFTEDMAKGSTELDPSEPVKLGMSLAEIKSIRTRAYGFFSAALLLASTGFILVVYIYKKNIVEPLRLIGSAAKKMSEGQFEEVHLTEGTELGILADSFNFMGRSLKDKINELEDTVHEKQGVVRTLSILNELNGSIIFKLNVDEVVETICMFSANLLKAETTVMLLVDKLSREVTHFFSSQPEAHEDIISVSNNVLKDIVGRGMPIKLSSSSDSQKFQAMVGNENSSIQNFLAVPIIIKGDILGVLIFLNKINSDKFSMNDEDTALIVAFQGAIAIEKTLFHEEIVQLAKTDGLTGLNNHRTFHETLNEELKRARRLEKYLSLLLIDMDYFKNFNDTHGHLEGDSALKALSEILNRNIRQIDFAARYGGEEFAIILPEASYEGAVRVAERIRSETSTHAFNVKGTIERLTVSIGIAVFPDDAIDREGLIKSADDALYMAKRIGRNRVVTFQQYKSAALETDKK